MKKFRFPLEKLERWRETRLNAETALLERLLADDRSLKQRREVLAAEENQARARIRQSEFVLGAELHAVDAFRRWADLEYRRLDSAESELATAIAGQRAAVLHAKRQVEVLGSLRKQRLAAWRAEADRETESIVAELVVARWRNDETT